MVIRQADKSVFPVEDIEVSIVGFYSFYFSDLFLIIIVQRLWLFERAISEDSKAAIVPFLYVQTQE